MKNQTFANSVNNEPITLESMKEVFEDFKPLSPIPSEIMIICSIKAHKSLLKKFEIKSTASPYLNNFAALNVHFYIKKYAKKLRIMDMSKFKLKFGTLSL